MSKFADFGVSQNLCRALKQMKIKEPTNVQKWCLKPAMEGRSLIACARTGSGKTLIFLLPIIQRLMSDPRPYYGLILCPTRELATQIYEQAHAYKFHIKVTLVIGGANQVKQSNSLQSHVNIVIGTPGRIAMHVRDNNLSFANLGVLVMDEADRLLSGTFGDDLDTIFKSFSPDVHHQTLLFTATIPTPLKVQLKAIAESALKQGKQPVLFWDEDMEVPVDFVEREQSLADATGEEPKSMQSSGLVERGSAHTVSQLKQFYLGTDFKEAYLLYLLREFLSSSSHGQCIVFTNKCEWVVTLHLLCQRMGVPSVYLHALAKQVDREKALKKFRAHEVRILFATNLASRGLDIPFVDLVINHAVTTEPADYVHRVGRTGRAGMGGRAISLLSSKEMVRLKPIQQFIGKELEFYPPNDAEVQKLVEEVTLHTVEIRQELKEQKSEREEVKKALKRKMQAASDEDSQEAVKDVSVKQTKKKKKKLRGKKQQKVTS